jgi:hypothetical protein
MKKLVLNAILISFGVSLYSCGDSTQNNSVNDHSNSSEEEVFEEQISETFILPSTVQMGQLFESAGLKYMKGVGHDPSKVETYNTKTKRLLNYGIYSTNLSYTVLNNQNDQATSYFKAVNKLANQIGFAEVFDLENMSTEFENSLGNRDKIIDLLLEIQERTDNFVDDNQLKNEALVAFAGAWIEGMYLGIKTSEVKDNHTLTLRLLEQMTILDNILKGLKPLASKNSEINDLFERLNELNSTYKEIDVIKDESISLRELEVSYSDLKGISDRVIAIRKWMTS